MSKPIDLRGVPGDGCDSTLSRASRSLIDEKNDLLNPVSGPDSSTDNHLAVFDGTDGKKLKDGGPPGGGGSFLSSNTARVDTSGDDSTGTIGDLSKPFKTVQAAINAFEAAPFVPNPLIDTGNNTFGEDVVTSLSELWFTGSQGQEASQSFASLTTTYELGEANIGIAGSTVGSIIGSGPGIFVFPMMGGIIQGGVTCANGPINIWSQDGAGILQGTISCPGYNIVLYNLNNDFGDFIVIDSAGSNITAYRTRIKSILSADNGVNLIDARVSNINNSSANTSNADIMLDPATMNFANFPTTEPGDFVHAWINGAFINAPGYTIPTSDPHVLGQIWCDTTAGFVVKVSQGA